MSGRMHKRVAIVTGATGALGEGVVRDFVAEGARVVMGARARNEGVAAELAAELGTSNVIFAELDVANEEHWTKAVALAESEFGPVTVLVNNAARAIPGTIESLTMDEFREVVETNLFGCVLGMRAVIPGMRSAGGGSILNVNSTAGIGVPNGLAAYGTSKWAIRGLTKIAAKELARDGIIVNGFHPGIIETPLAYHPDTGEPLVDVTKFAIPRRATVKEMAKYVTFAVSDGSSFTAGAELIADGGALLGPIPDKSL